LDTQTHGISKRKEEKVPHGRGGLQRKSGPKDVEKGGGASRQEKERSSNGKSYQRGVGGTLQPVNAGEEWREVLHKLKGGGDKRKRPFHWERRRKEFPII